MPNISIRNTFKLYKKKVIQILGKKSLYSDQISKFCRELFGHKYIGTYSQDKVPLNQNGYAIINSDLSGEPGTHWLALVFTHHTCYVYDSFGRQTKHLLPVLWKKLENKHLVEVDSDHKPEQYGNTQICGQLAIAWLLTVEKFGVERVIKVV